MKTGMHWKLPDGYDNRRIASFLEDRYPFRVDKAIRQERLYLDTFDWLLFGKSFVLFHSEDELILHDLRGRGTDVRVDVASTPTFADDIPAGPMRKRLRSLIKSRALLELTGVHVATTTYRVLNRDEKTVARLALVMAQRACGTCLSSQTAYLSLLPVRGYSKHARKLGRDMGPGVEIRSVDEAVFQDAIGDAGKKAGSYSARLDLQLDPGMRSDDAARMIMRRLLTTMRANEAGICADIDIEFLHDYRVAIRKTRSALSQIKGVFPAEVTARYIQDFRTLGQSTNALRDLDVYLQAETKYRAMLSEPMREDIVPLFDYLRSQRVRALAQVIGSINSPETECLLTEWAEYIDQPSIGVEAPNAAIPVLELSRQRIYRRYRRIVRQGKRLVQSAEDEELHALRIDCKKLRYLLEFFASLYPAKKLADLAREQKKLQDNLGTFNDLSVQQAHLMQIVGELPLDDPRTTNALVATGALVETLAKRQDQVRSEFAQRFTDFASEKNRNAYRELFTDK